MSELRGIGARSYDDFRHPAAPHSDRSGLRRSSTEQQASRQAEGIIERIDASKPKPPRPDSEKRIRKGAVLAWRPESENKVPPPIETPKKDTEAA